MRKLLCGAFTFVACTAPSDEKAAAATDTLAAVQPPAARVVTALPCDSPATAADRTICMPHRVGAITRTTTRAQLERIYGADKVRDDSLSLGEGEYAPAVILKLAANDSLIITWRRDSTIQYIDIPSPVWRTPEGIRIGSPLNDVVRAFGPVRIYGFESHTAGNIELPRLPATEALVIRAYPTIERSRADSIMGKLPPNREPYPADSPEIQALKPEVYEIQIHWAYY